MPPALLELVARDNLELYRRVTEMEEQDRRRLARIAALKLEIERLGGRVPDAPA
jgi:uncharacterized small protein (DUF1192 family)